MALLQALPDLRGRGRGAGRAARRARRAVRARGPAALYQIAIMARRDLDFAPDARGGFEMALLRMLAFRPDRLPGTGDCRRAAQCAARAAAVPRRRAVPIAPAPAAAPWRCRRAHRSPRPRAAGGDWPAIVAPARPARARRRSSRPTACCVGRTGRRASGCSSTVPARRSAGRSSSSGWRRRSRSTTARPVRLEIVVSEAVGSDAGPPAGAGRGRAAEGRGAGDRDGRRTCARCARSSAPRCSRAP